MFTKLKQKTLVNNKVLFPLVLLSVFFILLWPFKIFAASQTFQPNNINLTVNTYINGSSTPGSYGRIGLDSGANLTIRVVITLAPSSACTDDGTNCLSSSPISNIQFGTDNLFLNSSINGSNKIAINGVVAGLLNANTTVNNYKCFGDSISSVTKTPFAYTTCTFPSGFRQDSKGVGNITVGGVVLDKTFTINQSSLASFGINSASQRYVIYAYPGLFYGASGFNIGTNSVNGGWDMIFPNGGKAITIDTYDTQANANTANSTQGIPANVPAYGSVTSNAQGSGGPNPVVSFINQVISTIIAFFEQVIYWIFSYLVAPLIAALLNVHPYKDSFVAVIYPGWIVVRNICNIFFILALIIIAMATLFRVESYQYKHLITQLIIAALLINFSLVIAQAILGLADTVQAQFLGNNVTAINSLASNLLVNSNSSWINNGSLNANAGAVNGNIFTGTVQALFWLALSVGSFCVFCAILVFLIIRIVALWILLLISPIAYACGVLPSTAQYRSTWWQNFLKYSFFTPIMAFFLNLTVVMVSNAKNNSVLQGIANTSSITSSGGIASLIIQIGSNILILIFLIASLKVADQAGIYGASGITEMAQKGIFSPFAAAGYGLQAFGGYLNRRKREISSPWGKETDDNHKPVKFYKKAAFAILNPDVIKNAFAEDSKKKQETAHHLAEGAAIDFRRQILGWKETGLTSEYEEANLHAVEAIRKERPYNGDEPNSVKEALRVAILAQGGDQKNSRVFMAQLLNLAENKGINALMEEFQNDKVLNPEGIEYEFTAEGVNAFLKALADKKIFSLSTAGEIRRALSKIGYESNQTVLYEGINHHGNSSHPALFETDRINGRWAVVGKQEYDTIENKAYEVTQAMMDTDPEQVEALKEAQKTATTDDEKEAIESTFRKNLNQKVFKSLLEGHSGDPIYDKYGKDVPHLDHHTLENAKNWANSMAQKNSNLTKSKNAADVYSQTHWNSVIVKVNGQTELQEGGIVQAGSASRGQFFSADRGIGQEKTFSGLLEAYTTNKKNVLAQLIEAKRKEIMKSGRRMPSEEELEEAAKVELDLRLGIVIANKQGLNAGLDTAREKIISDAGAEKVPKWIGESKDKKP